MTGKLAENLEWMRQRGTSVILNWGEDTDLWECSWIANGERFTGFSDDPLDATRAAYIAAQKKAAAPTAPPGGQEEGEMSDYPWPCDGCGEKVTRRDRIETIAAGARYQQHLRICRKCVTEWYEKMKPTAGPTAPQGLPEEGG